VNIHERVLRAMNVPGQNHRDPWFAELYKSVLEDTKFIYQTKEATPFIFPGTGTGGWEAALTNTLSPGDKVVAFRYGLFSHLWVDMMQRLGLDVHVVDCPWGEGANESILEDILRKDSTGKIKAVCVVHNETTTGVTSDIAGVRAAMDAARHPALLLVDGVSSIGALNFRMDEWRVDVAVTGSQKALSLPTGLAYVAASPKVSLIVS
jgi:alanine-glyoxylate transaminase/serine-glyoxylate transaminase/serine-pyruvate transaminase